MPGPLLRATVVPHGRLAGHNKSPMRYQVTVVAPAAHPPFLRRYSDFERLHGELVAAGGNAAKLPVLPAKHLFGVGLWRDAHEAFLTRATALEEYLNALLGDEAMVDASAKETVALADFLELDMLMLVSYYLEAVSPSKQPAAVDTDAMRREQPPAAASLANAGLVGVARLVAMWWVSLLWLVVALWWELAKMGIRATANVPSLLGSSATHRVHTLGACAHDALRSRNPPLARLVVATHDLVVVHAFSTAAASSSSSSSSSFSSSSSASRVGWPTSLPAAFSLAAAAASSPSRRPAAPPEAATTAAAASSPAVVPAAAPSPSPPSSPVGASELHEVRAALVDVLVPSHHPLPLASTPWPHPSHHPLQVRAALVDVLVPMAATAHALARTTLGAPSADKLAGLTAMLLAGSCWSFFPTFLLEVVEEIRQRTESAAAPSAAPAPSSPATAAALSPLALPLDAPAAAPVAAAAIRSLARAFEQTTAPLAPAPAPACDPNSTGLTHASSSASLAAAPSAAALPAPSPTYVVASMDAKGGARSPSKVVAGAPTSSLIQKHHSDQQRHSAAAAAAAEDRFASQFGAPRGADATYPSSTATLESMSGRSTPLDAPEATPPFTVAAALQRMIPVRGSAPY